MSIEELAEKAIPVENVQRSRRFREMIQVAEEYYRLLESASVEGEELDRLKERLDELIAPYSNDPAYVAFLNIRRIVKLGG